MALDLLEYYRQQKISRRYRTIQDVLESIRNELPGDANQEVEKLEAAVDGLLKNAEVSIPDT
jgi:hypothetical protein